MLDLIHNLFGYMGTARVYSISHDFTGRVFHSDSSMTKLAKISGCILF